MIDYNAYIRKKLDFMPLRQLALKIGATPLTVSRWRDGRPVSYKYRLVLDAMEREENRALYDALNRDFSDR